MLLVSTVSEKEDYLVDLLLDLKLIRQSHIDSVRDEAKSRGLGLIEAFLIHGIINHEELATARAKHFGAEFTEIGEISPEIIALMPKMWAWKYHVIPLEKKNGKLIVAIADPSDLDTIDSINHLLNADLVLKVACEPDIRLALETYYPLSPDEAEQLASRDVAA